MIKRLIFYQLDYRFSRSDKSFEHVQNHTSFSPVLLRCNYLSGYVLRPKKEFSDLNWFKSDSSVILLCNIVKGGGHHYG